MDMGNPLPARDGCKSLAKFYKSNRKWKMTSFQMTPEQRSILSLRERVYRVKKKMSQSGHVISFAFNIPGAEKRPAWLSAIFKTLREELMDYFQNVCGVNIEDEFLYDTSAGCGFCCLVSQVVTALELKKAAINFENNSVIGRILDIDVMDAYHGIISRSDLGYSERLCFLCDRKVSECIGRRHSIEQLILYSEQCCKEYAALKGI
ncbi:Apo-citrate lyase phosphoribosyl-dephospho-CoA transferase [compost metagenome]